MNSFQIMNFSSFNEVGTQTLMGIFKQTASKMLRALCFHSVHKFWRQLISRTLMDSVYQLSMKIENMKFMCEAAIKLSCAHKQASKQTNKQILKYSKV